MIIARDLFYQSAPWIPTWQREVAALSRENQGTFEPPVMEAVVAGGYLLLGGEQLWLPRLLSSLAWLLGGIFLWSLIARLAGPLAASIGTSFYLLLPFAVVASRSFQPDPTMVMLVVASVWAMVRYDERPSTGALFLAAGLGALACVIHPRALLIVIGAISALLLARHGFPEALRQRDSWVLLVVVLLPALLIYGYAAASGAFNTSEAQANVMPEILISPFFWRGWALQVAATVGLVAFFGALLGTFLHEMGRPRALVLGLWAGYVALCLTFTYSVATHDYSHLQLVPIVAIAGSPAVALVLSEVIRRNPGLPARLAVVAVLAMAVSYLLVDARNRTLDTGWQEAVAEREQIGAAVAHSTRTIMLAGDYGVSLEYHGLLAGSPWPLSADLEQERLAGIQPTPAEARFARDFAVAQPNYFIVQDLNELALQPDLVEFLDRSYPELTRGSDYVIYRLTPVGQ